MVMCERVELLRSHCDNLLPHEALLVCLDLVELGLQQ